MTIRFYCQMNRRPRGCQKPTGCHIAHQQYERQRILETVFMIAEDECNDYDLPRADLLLVKRRAPQMKLMRVWRQGVRVF
ncbi:hypothetical protein B5S52_19285 [Pectobacterium brasiliense]|nr:hypothetical protein B5S52_19285 [Pectobacterium brasiliense]